MSGDYPIGTVATATVRGVEGVRVMLFEGGTGTRAWLSSVYMKGGRAHAPHDVTDIRPLVTLDLGEDIPRLREALARWTGWTSLTVEKDAIRRLLDQIEAQTRPPKPPEPQGLGAVVEDANGLRWTRVEAGADDFTRNPWFPNTDGHTQPREYDEIAAVRVLSEGVSA